MKTKFTVIFLALVIFSSGCIGVNREFKNIRSQILNNLDDDFDKQIEFSIGPVGFFIASQFVKFSYSKENIDKILSEVENIHIGIYNRLSTFSEPSLSLINNIAESIIDNDWKPLVKSLDGKEMVGVFVKDFSEEDIEELFVVTLTNNELILLKLQGSLGKIIEIIVKDHGHNLKLSNNN